MAPIKFEEQIKDKLENRSLKPSAESWNTLQDRLDNHDNKNKTVRFWWLGIAASIIGVIIVATQFFKSPEAKKELPVIVNTEKPIEKEPIEQIEDKSIQNAIVENEKPNTEIITSAEQKKEEQPKKTNIKTVKEQKAPVSINNSETVIASVNKTPSTDIEVSTVPAKELDFEELKVKEVVAEIIERQKTEGNVSEQEIDSLLKHAQRDILKQRIYDETTKTVNANSLLQDVESELEESFRSKVFEKLQLSFKTVKTAVAERNN